MKLLLYCTKAKNKYDRLVRDEHYGKPFYLYGAITENFESLNGKIVAECDFEVEEIYGEQFYNGVGFEYDYYLEDKPRNWNLHQDNYIYRESCLTQYEMYNYLGKVSNGDKVGYSIHIKNLHIFDEPRELSNFNKIIETPYGEEPDATITRAPQNMMKCCYEVKSKEWESGVLISIRPEWLCKILNGEKTIEVRKKVLKEML